MPGWRCLVAEPLTVLSGTLARLCVTVLKSFGVPMTLRRVTTIPSDTDDPAITKQDFACRGVAGEVKRVYDKKTHEMTRELSIVLSDPGVEPRADDVVLRADGSVAAIITSKDGISAVRPDFVHTIAYELSIRQV